ncbi:uncharacterized protein LOC127810609 isoform X2 [Diospyros lotus]|uniref:uncharacterized protein LOC127810609 isoform X2 n=1 Tax=Diospyros lotus TaxID=55363 RepID=UPI002253C302|nr:uncharacterized protein LOC127810609 isoform X2 [Diospyros lotus]
MDLSVQTENGNLGATAKLDGRSPGKDCHSDAGKYELQNGDSGGTKISRESPRKGENLVNGNLGSANEGVGLKRYDAENFSDSVGVSQDSNCNLGSGLQEITNGDDHSTASEFSDIVIEKIEGEVRAGEAGEEMPAMAGRAEEMDVSGENRDDSLKTNGNVVEMVGPHSHLPKPEAPPGVTGSPADTDETPPISRSQSWPENSTVDVPAIGKFIREKSNSLSAALAKRLLSLKDNHDPKPYSNSNLKSNVTEFNLSGLKVIVKQKNGDSDDARGDLELKGRVSFFSRSNCRDCSAVRSFFREQGLKFVEINIDVYPTREKELVERTGTSTVPQIFFNEKLFGGLVALNSLRNSGLFEQRLKEMLGRKCPDDAPSPPVYGFDDPEEDRTDEMVAIVRVLRQRVPIQDRLRKMKIVKNCFAGAEMVQLIVQHFDCGRSKAVAIGKELLRKHFIHHIFGENEFEDGNQFYRFLEHEPFIPRCFNFQGSPNDNEPKSAAIVSQKLAKIMSAILESYASEDRRHLDYVGISHSEEFRRYVNLVQDLRRLNIMTLSTDEKLAFFLNLYNAMVIHAVIKVGHPGGVIDRRSFFSDFQYLVGGYPYSLAAIKNGILRSNRRPPYSLVKSFGHGDKRLELVCAKLNPLIHFGICNGTRSSPIVRFYTPQGVESELRYATRQFFQRDGIEVDLAKRTVYLTRIMKWTRKCSDGH